jgi:DNA-binding transcriptional LysR family regulator
LSRPASCGYRHLRDTRTVGVRAVEQWEVDGASQRIEPVLVVNDLEVACACAVAGVGIARLSAGRAPRALW